jgi:glycosyltransferase involved in cell wall biosynthesis
MKILAVNIAFRDDNFYKRWKLLVDKHKDQEIMLIGPKRYIYKKFGNPIVFNPESIHGDRFNVRHVNMNPNRYLRGDWWDWEFIKHIIDFKPDIIYLIGYESRNALFMSKIASIFIKKKVIIGLFSMRGTNHKMNIATKLRWHFGKKWYNFINVHYPFGSDIYRKSIGFAKPICLQTQIGVNADIFYPNEFTRKLIRDEYNIGQGEIVFGSAIRIQENKGIFDILDAIEKLKFNCRFLLIGDGVDSNRVREYISSNAKLRETVIWPGRIDGMENVAAYLNAMDIFIHVPRTTKDWVDTFPLAVVQAMAVGLPIIGSSSGAVPYQLGRNGIIIREGNVNELSDKMEFLFSNIEFRSNYGKQMLERVKKCFEINHLNDCLVHNFECHLKSENNKLIKDQCFKDN